MKVDYSLKPVDLKSQLANMWQLSGRKILAIEKEWDPNKGTPVFTVAGKYTTRGWTEWTQGFQYGSAVLQFDATGDEQFLDIGKVNTVTRMAAHVTHTGVHDHGFNNISTYGNLRRLMREGRIPHSDWELNFYELAIKASGAVQAARWSPTAYGSGYIQSFNGPHSLFSDTIRSLRAMVVAHTLGHALMGEGDRAISLLGRAIEHARTTALFNVYYGLGRDGYDEPGRVVHESIFNVADGAYRCPSSQQGYSPFTTWTRGLSWVITGYAEQLEFLETLSEAEIAALPKESRQAGYSAQLPPGIPEISTASKQDVLEFTLRAAKVTADFWVANTPSDGISYWDTGAPGLAHMGAYLERPADPYNNHEPVDSTAAAIAAQGLLRLGRYLQQKGDADAGQRYLQAGLTMSKALFDTPYLAEDPNHQGLLLHSIYHRPNGWDHVPAGSTISHSESSMWGDYHLRELALLLWREIEGKPYLTFFA